MRANYILKLLENDERIDGRKLDEFRKIVVEKNIVERAEGSARVKLGKTEVIIGVKMDFSEPFPDSPNMGMLKTEAEFIPLAHPDFTAGPPGEDATEVARIIDRGIRESESIDLEKLCLKEGEKVWCVFVDFYPINHDGNLIDAGSLAATAALSVAKIPNITEDEKIDRENLKQKLPLLHKSVAITVAKIGNKMLVDPTFEEEQLVDVKLTIAVTEEGKVCAMQKGGSGSLSEEEIEKMIDLAVKKSKELLKLI